MVHSPVRRPKGAPNSTGGRFDTSSRSDPQVVLREIEDVSRTQPSGRTRTRFGSARQWENLGLGELLERRRVQQEQYERLTRTRASLDEQVDEAMARWTELDRRIALLMGIPWAVDREESDAARPDYTTLSSAPTSYLGPTHVDDVVDVDGYGVFHRARPGVSAGEPNAIRVQVSRELTRDEAQHLAQLVGYAYAATGGERIDASFQDSPNSIVLDADTTKGRAYQHLADRFERDLDQTVQQGSPLRKTDRSGAGTAGTRLVDALDGAGAIHIYYDSVTTD